MSGASNGKSCLAAMFWGFVVLIMLMVIFVGIPAWVR